MTDQRRRDEQTVDVAIGLVLFAGVVILGGGLALLVAGQMHSIPRALPEAVAVSLLGCGTIVALGYLLRRGRRP